VEAGSHAGKGRICRAVIDDYELEGQRESREGVCDLTDQFVYIFFLVMGRRNNTEPDRSVVIAAEGGAIWLV